MLEGRKSYRWIWVCKSLVVFVVCITNYLPYQGEQKQFKNEKYPELAARANLKIEQIVDWWQERLANIKYLYHLQAVPSLRLIYTGKYIDKSSSSTPLFLKTITIDPQENKGRVNVGAKLRSRVLWYQCLEQNLKLEDTINEK